MINWLKYNGKFKESEFTCKCCGKSEISEALLDKLYQARIEANIPFVISSGYRCPKHNQAIGGKANSSHLKGKAVDILTSDGNNRYKLLSVLIKYFKRIGIDKRFIHVDIDESLPQGQVWFY